MATKKKSVKRPASKKVALRRSVKKVSRKLVRRPACPVKRKSVRKVAPKKSVGSTKSNWGVKFCRRKYLTEVRGPNGWVRKPGTWVVSDRVFGSKKEAEQHGKRFTKIEKHIGFSVMPRAKPITAWINWKTGKTNPIIGLKRTNRK